MARSTANENSVDTVHAESYLMPLCITFASPPLHVTCVVIFDPRYQYPRRSPPSYQQVFSVSTSWLNERARRAARQTLYMQKENTPYVCR